MRGEVDPQSSMFHYFSVESRIPADHPLRRVKKLAESALSAISAELDGLYARTGRPSIPPERLLKAQLLIAFYSVRSDRLFCEQLDYNLLFRWFLDLDLESGGLDYGGHALMENRSGLFVDLLISDATLAEHQAARQLPTRARRRKIHPNTLGADKGYHVKDFVQHLREHGIKPHIARIDGRKTPGLDGWTSCTEGYKVSQRKRKRVEEIFGWLKTVGGMRKTRFIGEARTQIAAYLSAVAYNLLRIAKLQNAGSAA